MDAILIALAKILERKGGISHPAFMGNCPTIVTPGAHLGGGSRGFGVPRFFEVQIVPSNS